MSDIVKPGLPDCMMPDGGEACAYVQWQADTITALRSEVERLREEKAVAIKLMSDASRARGEAEGKLAASEMAGALDGWIEKAKALEADNARLREALAVEREESLWNAYHAGIERDGKWWPGGMSDAEWLERAAGLKPGWHDALALQECIPLLARAALAGKE